jgi:hypothetical protein
MIRSHSSHLLPPSPHFPPLCALSVSVFSSLPSPSILKLSTLDFLRGFCSGGSSDPCHSPIPHLSNSSLSRTPMAVGCELSTVSRFTRPPMLTPLMPRQSISPLFATLTENTGGGGTSFQPRNLHCHPRRLSYLPTSLLYLAFSSVSHTDTRNSNPFMRLLHSSLYTELFSIFPSPTAHTHCPCPLPIRKQAPAPAVLQPSGRCAREVPRWPEF